MKRRQQERRPAGRNTRVIDSQDVGTLSFSANVAPLSLAFSSDDHDALPPMSPYATITISPKNTLTVPDAASTLTSTSSNPNLPTTNSLNPSCSSSSLNTAQNQVQNADRNQKVKVQQRQQPQQQQRQRKNTLERVLPSLFTLPFRSRVESNVTPVSDQEVAAKGQKGSSSAANSPLSVPVPVQIGAKLPNVKEDSKSKSVNSKAKLKAKNRRPQFQSGEVKIGCSTHEGPFHANEDRWSTSLGVTRDIDAYVGVFDGHGGDECADYASQVMSTHVRETFTSSDTWTNGENAMKDMFHDLEREFSDIAREDDDTSGACATVVLVKGFEAIVGNIGDCRAIAVEDISTGELRYEVLTDDHRADSPSEGARIERAGGSVVNGRVFNLQPSRSFGDLDVKDIAGEDVVIPTPEVRKVTMQKGGFMIIATDGLWDAVTNEKAVQCAAKILRRTQNDEKLDKFDEEGHENDEEESSFVDPSLAAEKLVQLALRNKATDDITVAVLVW